MRNNEDLKVQRNMNVQGFRKTAAICRYLYQPSYVLKEIEIQRNKNETMSTKAMSPTEIIVQIMLKNKL